MLISGKLAFGALLLGVYATACASGAPGVGHSGPIGSDEPDEWPSTESNAADGAPSSTALEGGNDAPITGIRFYFAKVFPPRPEDDDELFPSLCPSGDDCFYALGLSLDGELVLDDAMGRVVVSLDVEDKERAVRFLTSTELVRAIEAPIVACPGLPAGVDMKISFSSSWRDGVEMFYSNFEGCLVGELTGLEDHPLFQMRKFVGEELRREYIDCAVMRPLCEDFEFIDIPFR